MKPKKKILMQPNNIIKGRYNCTPTENKIFYKVLFNAQKDIKEKSQYVAKVSVDEFKDILKNNNDVTEKAISETLTILHQTILEFDYIDDNTKGLVTYKSGLIGESRYFHEQSIYEINIPEILYNHITDFIKMQSKGNGYTSLNLDLLFKFKSTYTQRLYTFLRLWSRENKKVEVKYTLKELRDYLQLKADIYSEYKHFKQKIIKRALKEINEDGNMQVEIKQEIRKGRKVDEIVFSVIDYEPRKYFDKKGDKLLDIVECKNIVVDEVKVLEEVAISVDDKKVAVKEVVSEVFIPDEEVFTKGTLRSFKKDFKGIDFRNEYMEKAFDDALSITMERDDVDNIKVSSYKFFKSCLDNKIVEYRLEEQEELKHKNEMDMNW
ncbi:MAG: replication initiation protein [Paraclostridium sp.]